MIQTEPEFLLQLELTLSKSEYSDATKLLSKYNKLNRKRNPIINFFEQIRSSSSSDTFYLIYSEMLNIIQKDYKNISQEIIFNIIFHLPIIIIGNYWSHDKAKANFLINNKSKIFSCFTILNIQELKNSCKLDINVIGQNNLKSIMNFLLENDYDDEAISYYIGFVQHNSMLCTIDWLEKFWSNNHFANIQQKDNAAVA